MTETERRLHALEQKAERQAASLATVEGLDITPLIADVYKPIHEDIIAGRHQSYFLKGGRGSGKSCFAALSIVSGIMKDASGQSNGIVLRRTQNTMRDSVFSTIEWAINMLDVGDLWRGNVIPMSFVYLPTGATITFRGVDDGSKLKSIRPKVGFFRYIWFEEADELRGPNNLRSVLQGVVRGGEQFTIFFTYNPPISKSHWINLYVQQPDETATVLHTTYKDMPVEWIGQAFVDEAERLKAINEQAFEHEYMGQPVNTGGLVFPNVETRTITDEEVQQMQYFYVGVDFGFSVDPSVVVRLSYDRKHEIVYILDEIYKHHYSNQELADAIKEKGFDRSPEVVYLPAYDQSFRRERQRIICDCAEPRSIHDLQGQGLHAVACKKWPGSVRYGVSWLQHRQIIIDAKKAPHAAEEFLNYEYMRDKDNNYTGDLPDSENHDIDAVRYALSDVITSRKEPA